MEGADENRAGVRELGEDRVIVAAAGPLDEGTPVRIVEGKSLKSAR